jgi:hypothetical protein
MSPTFRALCAELLRECQYLHDNNRRNKALWNRAHAALAQPEPVAPTAWMYQGEPDFDGKQWRENWKTTLDEKLARYMSGTKEPIPLWCCPAIKPVAPTDEELISPIMWMIDDCVYDNDKGEIAQSLRELIARWGAPANSTSEATNG